VSGQSGIMTTHALGRGHHSSTEPPTLADQRCRMPLPCVDARELDAVPLHFLLPLFAIPLILHAPMRALPWTPASRASAAAAIPSASSHHGHHCQAVGLLPTAAVLFSHLNRAHHRLRLATLRPARSLAQALGRQSAPPLCSSTDEPRAPMAGSPRTTTGSIEPTISFTVACRPSRVSSLAA
jgi:hypothetical protein